MSHRAWIVALAIGLGLTTLGQAQEQTSGEDRESATQGQPADPGSPSIRVRIVEDDAIANARQRREEESDQREIDDLIAQQSMDATARAMNDATQEMRDHAYAQTWLVGTGTVLLFITLWLTRQATRAAQSAVKVTQDIGEAQVRAYLTLDTDPTWTIMDYQPDNIHLLLRLKVRNVGQTPAKIVGVFITTTLCVMTIRTQMKGTFGFLTTSLSKIVGRDWRFMFLA